MSKYIVIKEFADKDYFGKHYVPGETLPDTFDKKRLENIVRLGLAKVEPEQKTGNNPGDGNNPGTGNVQPPDIDLSEKVADFSPKIEKLKEYPKTEKAAAKPSNNN
jgi:hypothetical protein